MEKEERELLLRLLNTTPLHVDVARLASMPLREAGPAEAHLLRRLHEPSGVIQPTWFYAGAGWRSQPYLLNFRSAGLNCLLGSRVGFDCAELWLAAKGLGNTDIQNWYGAGLDIHTQTAELFGCDRYSAKLTTYMACYVPSLSSLLLQATDRGVDQDVARGIWAWLRAPYIHDNCGLVLDVEAARKIIADVLGRAALTCFARDIAVRAIFPDYLLVSDRPEIALDALNTHAQASELLCGVRTKVW